MRARPAHIITTSSYDFRYAIGDSTRWQWFCTCGELASGFDDEETAAAAGDYHAETSPTMTNAAPRVTSAETPISGAQLAEVRQRMAERAHREAWAL